MADEPGFGTSGGSPSDVLAGLSALMGGGKEAKGPNGDPDASHGTTPPEPSEGFTNFLERCERKANGLLI